MLNLLQSREDEVSSATVTSTEGELDGTVRSTLKVGAGGKERNTACCP